VVFKINQTKPTSKYLDQT